MSLPPATIHRTCAPGVMEVELDNEPGVRWLAKAVHTGGRRWALLIRNGTCEKR